MSTNEVVQSVAKNLKYYFQIKRLEDGFDLSDVHQPILSHPPLKSLPAHQNDGLHDRALKHYFSDPDVRIMLTQLNSPYTRGALQGWREIEVRNMLDNYMTRYSFKKRSLQSCNRFHPHRAKPHDTGILRRRKKKQRHISGGWPILRTVPDQYISKGETDRLVNSATKIICSSVLANSIGKLPNIYNEENKLSVLKLFQNDFSTSTTARNKRVSHNRHLPEIQEKTSRRTRSENRTNSDPKSTSPTQSSRSSTGSYSTGTSDSLTSSSSSTSSSYDSTSKQSPSRNTSSTVINMPEQKQQEKVCVAKSTQTAATYDVDNSTDRQQTKMSDKLEKEVNDGAQCEYQVFVKTGYQIGAGTTAQIKLTLYGDKGRTKEFGLNSLSKRHKIPFQKGSEDVFTLPAHHLGRLRKVQIGHDRAEFKYAWFLDKVSVFDMHAKRIYQFPCGCWLSGYGGDKKPYRILYADREREFMEALDTSMTKLALNKGDYSVNSVIKTEQSHGKKINDGDSRNKSQGSSKNSSLKISSRVGVESESSRHKQRSTAQREHKKDNKQRATKIILHSMPGNKVVEEIFLDTSNSTDTKNKPEQHFVEDFKSSTPEQEQKKQLESKKEVKRDILKDKSIHNAVIDGDIDTVKDLLHHFPEMKDTRDDKGWTPLHVAATSGNMEILRWLVTSDSDINAETPAGYTVMHIAAMNGHVNSMMVLQAMGASIFSLTKEKQTALHLSAKSGHLECVKWLVANRASLDAKDSSGYTAYQLAEEYKHESCASFLRICMREFSNPKSPFVQMQDQQINGAEQPSLKQDTISQSSENEREKVYAD